MKTINVVAGIIKKDNKIFIAEMENLKECMNFLVGRLSLVKNLKMH